MKNLKAELKRQNVDSIELAKALGMNPTKLLKKLNGEEELNNSEMIQIFNFLRDKRSSYDEAYFSFLFYPES